MISGEFLEVLSFDIMSNNDKNSMCLRTADFLFPLKHDNVARRTNTALDVLQEHKIDDWNVDGDRKLSGLWTRFTHFTILSHALPQGEGGDSRKYKQRPGLITTWPEVW